MLLFFFFNDTATTEIYTLSLHDALPISSPLVAAWRRQMLKTPLCELFGIEVPIILAPMGTCTSAELAAAVSNEGGLGERKSTRLNSSHSQISYAVFCLKKKTSRRRVVRS